MEASQHLPAPSHAQLHSCTAAQLHNHGNHECKMGTGRFSSIATCSSPLSVRSGTSEAVSTGTPCSDWPQACGAAILAEARARLETVALRLCINLGLVVQPHVMFVVLVNDAGGKTCAINAARHGSRSECDIASVVPDRIPAFVILPLLVADAH